MKAQWGRAFKRLESASTLPRTVRKSPLVSRRLTGAGPEAYPTAQLAALSAITANAVAASLMKRPMSEAGSRCLFSDQAGQWPSAWS